MHVGLRQLEKGAHFRNAEERAGDRQFLEALDCAGIEGAHLIRDHPPFAAVVGRRAL